MSIESKEVYGQRQVTELDHRHLNELDRACNLKNFPFNNVYESVLKVPKIEHHILSNLVCTFFKRKL